jgi:hypothetical protein
MAEIYLSLQAYDDAMGAVIDCRETMNGLAVHRGIPPYHRKWVVTHIRSGRLISARRGGTAAFARHAAAIAFMRRVAHMGPWRRWKDREDMPNGTRRRVSVYLRAIPK